MCVCVCVFGVPYSRVFIRDVVGHRSVRLSAGGGLSYILYSAPRSCLSPWRSGCVCVRVCVCNFRVCVCVDSESFRLFDDFALEYSLNVSKGESVSGMCVHVALFLLILDRIVRVCVRACVCRDGCRRGFGHAPQQSLQIRRRCGRCAENRSGVRVCLNECVCVVLFAVSVLLCVCVCLSECVCVW